MPSHEQGEQAGRAVVLAHPEALQSEAFTRILVGAGYRVAARISRADAIESAVTLNTPDIVLVHDSLLGHDLSLLSRIADSNRPVTAIMVCDSIAESVVTDVIRAGARGCLSCNDTPADFLAALEFLLRGATIVSPGCNRIVSGSRRVRSRAIEASDLSVRESQVAALIAQGFSNREIAGELTISEHTVKIHVGSILNKLNLRNRHQIAAYAVQEAAAESNAVARSSR